MKILIQNSSTPFYNLAVEKLKVLHKKDEIFESLDNLPQRIDISYFSAIFSWDMPNLCDDVIKVKNISNKINIGGAGTTTLADYIEKFTGIKAHIGLWDKLDEIKVEHPLLAFTSRGCIRNCSFCLVPKMEAFKEYKNFQVAPKIQDNNFLACSLSHRLKVYKKLKGIKNIDFNQGLDARLFNLIDLEEMVKLKMLYYRFAFDSLHEEKAIKKAIDLLKKKGITNWRKIPIYILYGFRDRPIEALYRINKVIALGARPFVMPYKPLNWLKKRTYYVNYKKGWTPRLMLHIARFYNRVWLFTGGKADIKEYMTNHKVTEFFSKEIK